MENKSLCKKAKCKKCKHLKQLTGIFKKQIICTAFSPDVKFDKPTYCGNFEAKE